MIPIDDYVLDVLMRDLVGHDRSPSAYLVYLHLWSQTIGRRAKSARLSHQMMASATGLSKSAVQAGMRRLVRRRLVSVHRESPRQRRNIEFCAHGRKVTPVSPRSASLLRQLGIGSATALVISNMIGTGILTTSGFLAGQLGSVAIGPC